MASPRDRRSLAKQIREIESDYEKLESEVEAEVLDVGIGVQKFLDKNDDSRGLDQDPWKMTSKIKKLNFQEVSPATPTVARARSDMICLPSLRGMGQAW